jgi:hypothetical protein
LSDFGSVELNKEGQWVVFVQCSITITGTKPTLSGGLPYFTLVSGNHGSYTILPTEEPAAPVLWAFAFHHEVTSSPETLSFTGEAVNTGAMSVSVTADYWAAFLATDDSAAPDATSVTVNPGSKLTVLRGSNR